jgi:hypothetical protein
MSSKDTDSLRDRHSGWDSHERIAFAGNNAARLAEEDKKEQAASMMKRIWRVRAEPSIRRAIEEQWQDEIIRLSQLDWVQ